MRQRIFDQLRNKIDELFGIDTRSLALMRVGFSLIVLYDFLFERLPNLTAHYGNGGVFPSEVTRIGVWGTPWPDLFTLLDKFPALPLLLIILGIVGSLFLLVGWHTRVASVAVWFSVLILQFLNPVILQGGDMYLRLCLFIGMFLPWGLQYSVDQTLKFSDSVKRILSPWTAAFLLQVGMVYFFAVLAKTGLEWTTDGTAVYYALEIDQFSTPLGEFVRQFPQFLTFLTFAVTNLQSRALFMLFFPVWTFPVRSVTLVFLLLMHIAFALHMNLGPFSFIACTALFAFIPTRFWDFLETQSRKRFGNLTIYFDGDCGFCKKSSHLLRTFLLLPNTQIIPAQENEAVWEEMEAHDSWVIVTQSGEHHFTYGAGIALLRSSPVFFWLAPLFNISVFKPIGEKVYRFIENHRKRVCLPTPPQKVGNALIRKILATISATLGIAYIIAVTSWNVSNIQPPPVTIIFPEGYAQTMRKIGLDQWWNMFAPFPLKQDGWYAISGVEKNGSTVNLMHPGEAIPTTTKPANVSALYPNERWRKYLMNLWSRDFIGLRPYYVQYLCRDWNTHHTGDEQLTTVDMTFMMEETLPNYATAAVAPVDLITWSCTDNIILKAAEP